MENRPGRASTQAGVKLGWLAGGGLFRWLSRGLVLGSLLLVLALRYLLDLNIILAAMVGFTVLLVGLLVLWLLVASGRLKIEAG
jgi:hypothetical protein